MGQDPNRDAAGFRQLYQDMLDSVLKGKGASSEVARQAAFNNTGLVEPVRTLIDKVANGAYRVT
ncbi:MAG TPA: hypothetical protein VGS79_12655, partial [Puia sp.]|nr:hypothetical protein [Puia sp.]